MSVCCSINEKKNWEEFPSEKYSESIRGNVKNSNSFWNDAKNSCEHGDDSDESSESVVNGYVMDISICSHIEEATDGYVIESYESVSSADKKKDVQEPTVKETSGDVKQCSFLKNEMDKDQITIIKSKMNPKKQKSEQEPSSEQRNLSLRRGERRVFPGYSKSRGNDGEQLSNVNRQSERSGSDGKKSFPRLYRRTDSEEHVFKAPEVCGIASLRMQRLKKQLEETRRLRDKLSSADSSSGKKTLHPVGNATYPGYPGTARSRLIGEDKPYSVSAPFSQGGQLSVGSGLLQSDHMGALLHPRDDNPVPVSAPSTSSSVPLATRSGICSGSQLVKSLHPGRDHRSYSMFSNPLRSVPSEEESEPYALDCPVGYKKPGDRESRLLEAYVVGRTDTAQKIVPMTREEITRKGYSIGSLGRVTVQTTERPLELPKETSLVPLFTRRRDMRTNQPKGIQIAGGPHEQLNLGTHNLVSRSYSSSERVFTGLKAIDTWKTTSDSSGSVPRNDLPKNQKSQELVPANQWGRPHKSEGKGTDADFLRPLGRPRSIHRSKGGIAKVSTRVMKQVRAAAPILKAVCHRQSNPVETETTKSSVDKSKIRPVSVSEAKVIPSIISCEESMDWEPIEPEQVVQHVGELRKQSNFQTSASCSLANLCNPNVLPSKWFIIVDTNIFLSHLSFVENLRDTKDPTLGMPTLLVPWVVLNELDCLKGSSSKERLKYPAIRAINFVWRSLVSKHPRLEGQHPSECDKSMGVKADDSILQCCIKMKEKSEKVALLTNDHNLQNKALVSGIECFSAKELQRKIAEHELVTRTTEARDPADKRKKEINSYLCELKDCMKVILGEVLLREMLDAYGPMWKSIIARKPPLSLSDILFCLLKHWLAVFGMVLSPPCKELFKKLEEKFAEKQAGSSWFNLEMLIKVCCEVTENLPLHRYDEKINGGVRTLNELRSVCDKKINMVSGIQSQSPAAGSAVMPPSTSQTGVREGEEEHYSECGSYRSNESNVSCGSGGVNVRSGAKSMNESFDDYLSLHASSLSDGASDISAGDLAMDNGQRIVQHYLDEIFKKVATFCGLLCEMMGLVPSVAFDRPECLPSIEALQQNMPLVFPCVHNLLLNIQRVLAVPVHDLSEDHSAIVNLYHTVKDSLPVNQPSVGPILPLHILAYCTDDNTRQSLERGAHQFEQFEAIFNKAVLFFMGQNRPTPLPSF